MLACTAVALPVAAAVAPAAPVPAATTQAAATRCDTTSWGSTVDRVHARGGAPITEVRTGRHDCFDRVVYTLSGPAAGYHVEYVDQVTQDGSGEVFPVPGGARLLVRLHHPAYHDGRSTIVPPAAAGRPVADVTGYPTLRSVVYGGSFEGDTVLGVGVRARLPFRVLVLDGPGGGSRLVLDVAHRWS